MPTTTTTVPATTTTEDPGPPIQPLTGRPLDDPSIMNRPALVVKIDNSPERGTRPHAGLNQADVVFEIQAEGISRYAAVFHSTDAQLVGPIRSGRTGDLDLVSQLNHPLYKCSGANGFTLDLLENSPLLTSVCGQEGDTFRDHQRAVPHNLFSRTESLWALALPGMAAPKPIFHYRPAGTASVGDPVGAVRVVFQSTAVVWRWDADRGGWARTLDGSRHVDTTGLQIAPQNVVIVTTAYRRNPATGSPEAISVASGDALVLTDGKVVPGTWKRDAPTDPYDLRDAQGNRIVVTPGQTWVQLAAEGDVQLDQP